jgi:hypothetical protein
MGFAQYDVVRVKALRKQVVVEQDAFNKRNPMIGDVATIVEVYTSPPGYELECSDADGITEWLLAFAPEEIVLEKVA